MIYLVCFGISALFAHFANKTQKRSAFILLSVMSILVTVTLAGLRDYSIGIDTSNYLTMSRFWGGAVKHDTLRSYMGYYFSLGLLEPLFALVLGIVEETTGNFSVFLFVAHTVIVTGVYIGAFRMRRYAKPELILLLFYLLYYNSSLNILRQYMAMAIVFAFFMDVEQHRYARYFIAVVIAALIHTTAILSIVPLVVHLMLNFRKPLERISVVRLVFLCILIFGASLFVLPLVKWMNQIGVIPEKYSFYFQSGKRMSITRTLLHIFELMGILLCFRSLKKNGREVDLYIVNSIIFLLMYRVCSAIKYGDRIALYFAFANMVTLAMLPCSHKKRENRILLSCVIIGFSVYLWYYTYVGAVSGETYPYVSILSNK